MTRFPLPVAIAGARWAWRWLCGLWNGLLVAGVGMQPIVATLILMVAGRGIAQLLTDGQIITVYYAPFFFLGNGFLLGLPFALFIVAAVFAALHLADDAHARSACSSRPSASTRRRRAWPACGPAADRLRLRVLRLLRRHGRPDDQLQRQERRRQQRRLLLELDAILAVTLGGTALTGGRSAWRAA